MSTQDLLNEFDGVVEVSELYERAGEYQLSGTDVIEGLADSLDFDPEVYDNLKTAPVLVEEELEKTGDDAPGAELMMYRLAEFAYENDYDQIQGCIALEKPFYRCDYIDDEYRGKICGFGYSDETRYVFYSDGSPWYEHLKLVEIEGPMFFEHYLKYEYVCVEPILDQPFWETDQIWGTPMNDWPPDFDS